MKNKLKGMNRMENEPRYVLRYISGIPLLICATIPVNNCWMYELNEMGAQIWQQFEKKNSVENVIAALQDKMDTKMSHEQKKIIIEYCIQLENMGVIKNGVWV